ncbi:hypothetical protein M3Y94_00919300 [Aphelenchoides besseyi]|nr:hypothetical protein M3Y94_00919300 [Aphelenchoides besseyi]KAI6223204.1 hypothetical protein M3Y95_00864600 [Aphelenchoides besseyi]
MRLLILLVTLTFGTVLAVPSRPFNIPHENRTLIVMVAPSIWDEHYREDFFDIINFQLDLAKTIHEHENVVMIADKHTMPFLDGRVKSMSEKRLPYDSLIETNFYDPNVHDYAPMGAKSFVKFVYRTSEYADLNAKQVDDGMNDFLMENHIRVDKREPEMALSARDIVDNGINKAIISKSVIRLNDGKVPDWAVMAKLLNAFKKVVAISHPERHQSSRFDDLLAFIDEDILAVSALNEKERATVESELFLKFRSEVMLVDLPASGTLREGTCGIYTAALITNKFVYLPVYGSDPNNWAYGFSTMLDKMVLHMIEANTRKKVVPISVPRAFCRRGLSLKSIAWTVRGHSADQIISIPRRRFAAFT